MSRTTIPVSVIILTHNEEANIGACIESLDRFDEVVVVDSGSTDRTLEIVRSRAPRVRVLHNAFEDFGQQRNWALDHAGARNEWILFFDADERSTEAFAEAIARAVDRPGVHDGYFLCYRNMFLGRWIKRSTMFPSWQLRLLRAGKVRYRKEGHGQREVMDGTAGYIREPYDHYGFNKGIAEWVARHNAYSTNEVALIADLAAQPIAIRDLVASDPIRRRRAQKTLAARVPFRPLVRFLYSYVIRGGFLDGRAGLIYCLLRRAHEVHIVAKLAERAHAKSDAPPAQQPSHSSVRVAKSAS